MNVFQMKAEKFRKPRAETVTIASLEDAGEPETLPTIQGQEPGSREEWRFAVALQTLGLRFIYLFEVMSYPLRGSQKIDFWVFTTINPTPVYIQGVYWHGGSKTQESAFKIAELKRIYRGQIREPVQVFDYELPDIPSAIQIARERMT